MYIRNFNFFFLVHIIQFRLCIRNCTESCNEKLTNITHVYMGAHSHFDAFWLETYDEYLNGSGHDGLHSCNIFIP